MGWNPQFFHRQIDDADARMGIGRGFRRKEYEMHAATAAVDLAETELSIWKKIEFKVIPC